jgi:hypothetical protein
MYRIEDSAPTHIAFERSEKYHAMCSHAPNRRFGANEMRKENNICHTIIRKRLQ